MNWFLSIYRSPVGKKAVMAVTGILLFGFVLGHMLGNLKIFLGQAEYQAYADGLRTLGAPLFPHGSLLWIVRLVLLAAVALHIHAALTLWLLAKRARPRDYSRREVVQLDYAARTMRYGGVILLLYVIYHLMDLTWGTVHPGFAEHDVYHNVIGSFSVPWVAGVYIVANAVLGFHLYHGLWSLFQSLGWNHPRYNPWRRACAVVFSLFVSLGFIAVPVAVLTGLVR
jgi:succinate dehydrogenase cytochrome b subunit